MLDLPEHHPTIFYSHSGYINLTASESLCARFRWSASHHLPVLSNGLTASEWYKVRPGQISADCYSSYSDPVYRV